MLPRCISRPSPPASRSRRPAWLLLVGALLLPPAAAAQDEAVAPGADDPWSGTYDVTGLTVDQKTGDTRRIGGHVVLTRKGDEWAASAELATEYPSHGGPVHTDVIGQGEGVAKGDALAGTAHTQLVIQTVPGVDTAFAYIPRVVGPRLVSQWTARKEADGTLIVELSSTGEEGEDYTPTKTTLRGKRVPMPSEAQE